MTASRMRACACDAAARLCVRTVLCSSAFSLALPLRSTSSAAAEAALFARFSATSGRSDFSLALIIGYSLRPSRQRPGHDWRGRRWRAPGSRAKGFCACQGLRRRGVGVCLAISTPAVLPSVGRKTSAPRTCLTPLNTSPAPSPVNASRLPSRTTRASLGASAVRYSFTVTDFHRLPLAGLPAHPSITSEAAGLKFSFDQFISYGQQPIWDHCAKCFRSFQINHKFEFDWLLYRKVARLCTAQNLINGSSRASQHAFKH